MGKGVSGLIVVVLLIVATIAIGGIVSNWGKSTFRDVTTKVSNQSDELSDCVSARIDVSNLKIDRSSNEVEAIIGNSAFSDTGVGLVSIIIYDNDGNYCILNSTKYGLGKGEITIVKNVTCSIFSNDCEDFKSLTVTTNCIAQAEYSTNDTSRMMCINS